MLQACATQCCCYFCGCCCCCRKKIVQFLQSLIKVALISLSRLDNCKLNAKLIAPTHETHTHTHTYL